MTTRIVRVVLDVETHLSDEEIRAEYVGGPSAVVHGIRVVRERGRSVPEILHRARLGCDGTRRYPCRDCVMCDAGDQDFFLFDEEMPF